MNDFEKLYKVFFFSFLLYWQKAVIYPKTPQRLNLHHWMETAAVNQVSQHARLLSTRCGCGEICILNWTIWKWVRKHNYVSVGFSGAEHMMWYISSSFRRKQTPHGNMLQFKFHRNILQLHSLHNIVRSCENFVIAYYLSHSILNYYHIVFWISNIVKFYYSFLLIYCEM